jgi:Fur family ferric uptake transcriptional regulator
MAAVLPGGENVWMDEAPSTRRVLEALKLRGYRMTPQRRAIVSEIMATRGHIAPQELVQRVKDRLPGVNDSTVYRTLDLLEEMGFLSHAHLGAGPAYHHAEHNDHVHLICERCGKTDQLSVADTAPLNRALAKITEFQPDFTHFAISGLCARCAARAQGRTKPGSKP